MVGAGGRSARSSSPAPRVVGSGTTRESAISTSRSQLVNVNIGHQHPKMVQAIQEQADKLCTIGPPMANESRSRLGRMLAEVTPGDLERLVLHERRRGGERERGVKLARLVTGRHKILTRYRSYHGATNGER